MIGILRCYGILTLTEFDMLCEKYAIAIPSIEEYYLTALYLHPYFPYIQDRMEACYL